MVGSKVAIIFLPASGSHAKTQSLTFEDGYQFRCAPVYVIDIPQVAVYAIRDDLRNSAKGGGQHGHSYGKSLNQYKAKALHSRRVGIYLVPRYQARSALDIP